MAKFQGQVITKQGSNLLARALAGEGKFIFTKAAFGSQKHIEHLEDITNLKSLKLNLNVIKIFNDDGDVVLTLHVTNEHLKESFLTNEFGIYAKLEGDSEEILYSYAIAEEPDSIPANTFGTTYETTTEIYMNFASDIETDIHVREGAVFLTEPKANEIYVKNEYPVHGNLKTKTELKAEHIYFDDLGNFYLNTGGERTWDNSSSPDNKLIKVTFKTIYNWITGIWESLKTKEPSIAKNSGFNLDKTDEYNLDDTNKLVTARALKRLYDELVRRIGAIRLTWANITDKPNVSSAVNSNSETTLANSKAVKTANDNANSRVPRTAISGSSDTHYDGLTLKYATSGSKPSDLRSGTPVILEFGKGTGYTNEILGNFDGKAYFRSRGSDGGSNEWKQFLLEDDIQRTVGKDWGGVLNNRGDKVAGKVYFDTNTKKLFLCKNNNSHTSASANDYIPLDNHSLLERLENLFKKYTVDISNGDATLIFYADSDDNIIYGNLNVIRSIRVERGIIRSNPFNKSFKGHIPVILKGRPTENRSRYEDRDFLVSIKSDNIIVNTGNYTAYPF